MGGTMRAAFPLVLIATAMLPGNASGDIVKAAQRAKSGVFDAKGDVRCAQEVWQSLGMCSAAVARADGSAAVIVTFSSGFARMLIFSDGEFLRGNATMSGVGTDAEWHIMDGTYHVRVDDQRFEVPKALVAGK